MNNEFLVLTRTNGVTRTGSPYAMLKVSNGTEVMNISIWDMPSTAAPQVGQTVSFVNVRDNAGKKSCNMPDVQAGIFPMEGHPLYHLMPHPESRATWLQTISALSAFCKDEQLKTIIEDAAAKLYDPYSKYPAATSVHHAYPGGLLNHTHQMLRMLQGLYPFLPYPVKVERIILAVLFHDYGKICEYNEQGEPQPDMYLLGHIYISAYALQNELRNRGVDAEESKRIVHCILAHHGMREYGSPVLPCIPEASIVTYLDNLSSKADIMEGAGNMERVSALGTTVVK